MTPPNLKLHHAVYWPPDPREPDMECYKLAGFEEVDRWAFENQPLWNQITKENKMLGLSEEDRLRTLATFYMRRCVELGEQYARYQMENPGKVVGPKGEIWRYVGP